MLITCEQVTDESDKESISARVYPALIPRRHPLATVRESFSIVFIEAEAAGHLVFYDNDVGGSPTASAVLGDLVAATRNIVCGGRVPGDSTYANLPIPDFGDVRTRCHIDLRIDDRAGVLTDVARIFSDHNVSLRTVRQGKGANGVRLVIMARKTLRKDLEATINELRANDAVLAVNNVIRVGGVDI